jgi:enolase-phosphatase E1
VRTRALLLDVEGTTTPLDFVHATLFPYAAAHVEEFLRRHGQEDDCAALLEEFRSRRESDARQVSGVPPWSDATPDERLCSATTYIRWLIEHDSKIAPLKALEGKIWEAGYHSGELCGSVYPDVPRAFARWRAQGRRIAIFSSGSVLAQKLLFGYSSAGDLSRYVDDYFDTTTGAKREAESYRRIAAWLGLAPGEVLFLSDVPAELDAARSAGMQMGLCLRPRASEPDAPAHPILRNFDDLFP